MALSRGVWLATPVLNPGLIKWSLAALIALLPLSAMRDARAIEDSETPAEEEDVAATEDARPAEEAAPKPKLTKPKAKGKAAKKVAKKDGGKASAPKKAKPSKKTTVAKKEKSDKDKKVKKGSLLICMASGSKSHLGKVAFIDDDYGYAFGGFMGMITPLNGLLPEYLFHLMTSEEYKHFIGALSDGANINNLTFDKLKVFPVPVPPLSEQRRIVDQLDALSTETQRLARIYEQKKAALGELKKSLLHQAFSGEL